jgi:hypothetical protein
LLDYGGREEREAIEAVCKGLNRGDGASAPIWVLVWGRRLHPFGYREEENEMASEKGE